MNLPLELIIGLKYTRAKRRNHFISFISLISMLGITLGVVALIVVLSVMNGFEKELRGRILGMVSHVTVSTYEGRLREWSLLRDTVADNSEIIGSAPYVEAEAMLSSRSSVSGTIVRGIDPELEPTVSDIHRHLTF